MRLYMKIKNSMIEKHPVAVEKYADYVNSFDYISPKERFIGYLYFVKLLFNGKTKKIINGEFEDNRREDINKLINKLLKYDVISFDIFDTLILRNVELPKDVFRIVGMKIGVSGYERIRTKAENYCKEKYGCKYTIKDICCRIEEVTGVDSKKLIKTEFDTELQIIQENPYLKKVYESIVNHGKKIIIVSDMYWPQEYLKKILYKCGYDGWTSLYVSCDYEADKRSGRLYDIVKNDISPNTRIIHVGDNRLSDVLVPQNKGISSFYYENVAKRGKRYRNTVDSCRSLGESVSNAILNNFLHNGIEVVSGLEEFGFSIGGVLVDGFCHWLNEVAEDKKIDKLLFLARDADIIYQSYSKYYMKFDCEYVYVSRRAVILLAIKQYPELFVDKVLYEIANEYNLSVGEVLKELHIDCLIDKLSEINVNIEDKFDFDALKNIEQLIYKYKLLIDSSLTDMFNAAKNYWKSVIDDNKTIAFVDVGYNATIYLCLDFFLNSICSFDVEIKCLQIRSFRNKWNQQSFDQGKILSYNCSSDFNTEYNNIYIHDLIRAFIMELPFSSCGDSVIEYKLDDSGEGYELVVAPNSKENNSIIKKIHSGILLYVEKFNYIEKQLNMNLTVSGESSIKPIFEIKNNKKYLYKLFNDYTIRRTSGTNGADVSLKEYFKRNGY